MMLKKIITCVLLLLVLSTVKAQTKKADTVIVELAKTSRVVFTMRDRTDLSTLRAYDYQALFNDILTKLEKQDTTVLPASAEEQAVVKEEKENWSDFSKDDDDDWTTEYSSKGGKRFNKRTWQSFNFDIGTNNFLNDGKFPDDNNANYSVRPWGSWYVGLNSIQRTRVTNKFFVEWGLGASWYNFKFQNDNTVVGESASEVTFTESDPAINPLKSKLTVMYLNASIVPVLDFSGNTHKSRFWDNDSDGFRIGVGPYVGYRIDSYYKQVYKEDGDKERDRTHNNFYLNNLRYGARLQLGYKGTDLFFNYDFNELFVAGKGPQLNAFSFGVIF